MAYSHACRLFNCIIMYLYFFVKPFVNLLMQAYSVFCVLQAYFLCVVDIVQNLHSYIVLIDIIVQNFNKLSSFFTTQSRFFHVQKYILPI